MCSFSPSASTIFSNKSNDNDPVLVGVLKGWVIYDGNDQYDFNEFSRAQAFYREQRGRVGSENLVIESCFSAEGKNHTAHYWVAGAIGSTAWRFKCGRCGNYEWTINDPSISNKFVCIYCYCESRSGQHSGRATAAAAGCL